MMESYKKSLKTRVAEVGEDFLILEETIFHLQGGGQPSDRGRINDEKIISVRKNKYFVKNASKFREGQIVELFIDWDYRYKLMKAHTAEHLFYQCLNQIVPVKVKKISLSSEESCLFVSGEISFNDLIDAQVLMMKKIKEGLPVRVEYYEKDSDYLSNIRIKKNRIKSDTVRVVKIGDFDESACTGTHLKNIKEIGFFIITGFKSAGNNTSQISYVVGENALNEIYRQSTDLLRLSYDTMVPVRDLYGSVMNVFSERDELKTRIRKISGKMLDYKEFTPRKGIILESFSNINNKKLIGKAVQLSKEKECVVVFLNNNNLIVAGEDSEKIFSKIIKELGGKGGGKSNLKIGCVDNPDFDKLKSKIL